MNIILSFAGLNPCTDTLAWDQVTLSFTCTVYISGNCEPTFLYEKQEKNFLYFRGKLVQCQGLQGVMSLPRWLSFYLLAGHLSWPSCSGVAAMASEQWPGHALLCQGWPLESLLVNGFKFWTSNLLLLASNSYWLTLGSWDLSCASTILMLHHPALGGGAFI